MADIHPERPPSPGPSDPQRAVTLRDIAKALGLSHVTVSLALRGHRKIPEPRRRQIQQTAREMGYSPSAPAQILSSYRRVPGEPPTAVALAWLSPDSGAGDWRRDEEGTLCWQGACQEAERLGYALTEFSSAAQRSSAKWEKLLCERNCHGILIPEYREKVQDLDGVLCTGLPNVRLGRPPADGAGPFVATDDVSNAILAFAQIWAAGYRRVGLLVDHRPGRSAHSIAGFLYAQSTRDKAVALPPLDLAGKDGAVAPDLLQRWFFRHRPDALILEHSEQLRRLGTTFPAEIGVVLLDVPKRCENGLAGIRRNSVEVGRMAVQMLVSQINDDAGGLSPVLNRFLVEGTWLDGPSLPGRE